MPSSPDQHAHLNGAYYGPSPPKDSYHPRCFHRPDRGDGLASCLCCCCECIGCCIFQFIFQILLTVIFFLVLFAFLFRLLFRPNLVKFHVTGSELTQFNLSSSNNVLNYDLGLNLTVRNPNRKIGIYYDSIEVTTHKN